jgi:hypothetical protein
LGINLRSTVSIKRLALLSGGVGSPFYFAGGPLQETRDHRPTGARLRVSFSSTTSRMQADGSDILPWTVENLDRKDLFSMWRNITHALISTGHVAELHQELGYASRTGREDLGSDGQWAEQSSRMDSITSQSSSESRQGTRATRMLPMEAGHGVHLIATCLLNAQTSQMSVAEIYEWLAQSIRSTNTQSTRFGKF